MGGEDAPPRGLLWKEVLGHLPLVAWVEVAWLEAILVAKLPEGVLVEETIQVGGCLQWKITEHSEILGKAPNDLLVAESLVNLFRH